MKKKHWKDMWSADHFMQHVSPCPNTGCWFWAKTLNTDGYGVVHTRTKMVMAHRLSYELFKGPINKPVVMHSCDCPTCVNPAHLSLGTQKGNVRDTIAKGRNSRHLEQYQFRVSKQLV